MHAKYPIIDEHAQAKVVEDVCAVAPHVHRAVLAQALVVEAIDLRRLSALVITTHEPDAVWETHFECEKEEECLDGVKAAVHKVADEEVIRLWAITAHLEEFLEVVELTVDVTASVLR